MEKIKVNENVTVWGWKVNAFPKGIAEAFDDLMNMLPDAIDRQFYGISFMEEGIMTYIAAVEEAYTGEAEKYNCTRYTIDKGVYMAVTVRQWKHKKHTIKDVFEEISDHVPDFQQPGVEWYKNDDEMICMVRIPKAETA